MYISPCILNMFALDVKVVELNIFLDTLSELKYLSPFTRENNKSALTPLNKVDKSCHN